MDIIRPSSTSRLARNISLIARRLPRATELLSSVDSVPPFSTTGMRLSYHVWTQNAEQGLTSHHARVRTLASALRRRGPDIGTSSRARAPCTHLLYGHYVYYIHYSDIRDNIQDVMNNAMDITNNISLMRDSSSYHFSNRPRVCFSVQAYTICCEVTCPPTHASLEQSHRPKVAL